MKLVVLVIFFASTIAQAGFARRSEHGDNQKRAQGDAGACKDKREAKHQSRQALHQCLEAWAKESLKLEETDPSDDCSTKLSAFTQSAKDLKTCRNSAKDEKKDSPKEEVK